MLRLLSVRTYCIALSTSKKHVRRYRGGDISVRKKKPSPLSSSSIEVPVNNVLTKVLVDTGASISLIHAEVLHRMTHEPLVSSSLTEVHTANCGFISLLGIVKLNIPIGQFNTTADVYVTRDLVCPMILGRDWTHKNQVTLCFSQGGKSGLLDFRSTEKSQEVRRSTEKYREVPRSTKKSQEVPRSTKKYREVPRSTEKYREV
jgi:hypothetical protein